MRPAGSFLLASLALLLAAAPRPAHSQTLPEGFLHYEAPASWRSTRAQRALLSVGVGLMLTDRHTFRLFDNDRRTDPQAAVDDTFKRFNFLAEGSTLAVSLGLAQALTRSGETRRTTRVALTALASSTVATTLIKGVIGKERPDQGGEPHYRGPSLSYSSFPSGHTAAAMAVAHVHARLQPRQRGLWYGFVGMVAYSRVSSNKHWLSDTAWGAGIGLLAAEGALAGGRPGLSWRF